MSDVIVISDTLQSKAIGGIIVSDREEFPWYCTIYDSSDNLKGNAAYLGHKYVITTASILTAITGAYIITDVAVSDWSVKFGHNGPSDVSVVVKDYGIDEVHIVNETYTGFRQDFIEFRPTDNVGFTATTFPANNLAVLKLTDNPTIDGFLAVNLITSDLASDLVVVSDVAIALGAGFKRTDEDELIDIPPIVTDVPVIIQNSDVYYTHSTYIRETELRFMGYGTTDSMWTETVKTLSTNYRHWTSGVQVPVSITDTSKNTSSDSLGVWSGVFSTLLSSYGANFFAVTIGSDTTFDNTILAGNFGSDLTSIKDNSGLSVSDLGAPLVVKHTDNKYYLVGLYTGGAQTTYGIDYLEDYYPDVFVDIQKYLGWIETVTHPGTDVDEDIINIRSNQSDYHLDIATITTDIAGWAIAATTHSDWYTDITEFTSSVANWTATVSEWQSDIIMYQTAIQLEPSLTDNSSDWLVNTVAFNSDIVDFNSDISLWTSDLSIYGSDATTSDLTEFQSDYVNLSSDIVLFQSDVEEFQSDLVVLNNLITVTSDQTVTRDTRYRQRVSNPTMLFDYSSYNNPYDDNGEDIRFTVKATSNSEIRYNSDGGYFDLRVLNQSDLAIRQTKEYFPLNSLVTTMRGAFHEIESDTISRMGLYDDKNGFFFMMDPLGMSTVRRVNSSDIIVRQTDWLYDKMDGNGDSGIDLSQYAVTNSLSNIPQVIDLRSSMMTIIIDTNLLGVVRYVLVIDGIPYVVHRITSETSKKPLVPADKLPLRCEITKTGSGDDGTYRELRMVSGEVIHEGAFSKIFRKFNVTNAKSGTTNLTPSSASSSASLIPVISFRLKEAFINRGIFKMSEIKLLSRITDEAVLDRHIYWELVSNPRLQSDSWSETDIVAGSMVEFDRSAINYAGGRVIKSGFMKSSQVEENYEATLQWEEPLCADLDDSPDVLTLGIRNLTGTTNITFWYTLGWIEY